MNTKQTAQKMKKGEKNESKQQQQQKQRHMVIESMWLSTMLMNIHRTRIGSATLSLGLSLISQYLIYFASARVRFSRRCIKLTMNTCRFDSNSLKELTKARFCCSYEFL